ncbi:MULTISPECIES: hypothetical protein, partial [unclassified Streptomyces]|uniref:hypothetical protein n=1 Tax=unclassified Streptomyces TaxID=2593676 RepID=UPI0035DF1AF9
SDPISSVLSGPGFPTFVFFSEAFRRVSDFIRIISVGLMGDFVIEIGNRGGSVVISFRPERERV